MEKIIKIVLAVCVIGIFSFVLTYGAFLIKKEFDCKRALNGPDCYRTYQQTIQIYWDRIIH